MELIKVGPLVGLAFRDVRRLLWPFSKGGMVMVEEITTLFTLLMDNDDIGANVYRTSSLQKSLFGIFKQIRDMVGILENVTSTDYRLQELFVAIRVSVAL